MDSFLKVSTTEPGSRLPSTVAPLISPSPALSARKPPIMSDNKPPSSQASEEDSMTIASFKPRTKFDIPDFIKRYTEPNDDNSSSDPLISNTKPKTTALPSNLHSTGNTTSIFHPPPTTRYLLAPRLTTDVSTKSVVSKELRPINSNDLRKLRSSATSPLANKFGMVPSETSDQQILVNYNIQMRIKELRRKLETYDMLDVFNILMFDPVHTATPFTTSTTPVLPLPTIVNLLDAWENLTFDQVMHHVNFL